MYINTTDGTSTGAENIALPYVALSVGPLGKDVPPMVTRLSAIGYFLRIRMGSNPLAQMSPVRLMRRGISRTKGSDDGGPPFLFLT